MSNKKGDSMKAFHNKQSVKDKYIARVKAHAKADEIIKGSYWEDGKGCAVGCTIEGSSHMRYEIELGIPVGLAYLEDTIFEGMTNSKAMKFPLKFLEAIPVGADLSLVTAKFIVWQFEDKKHGLKNIQELKDNKEVYGFCKEVVALYKRKIAGDTPTKNEFSLLQKKIEEARAMPATLAGALAWAQQYDILATQLLKLLKDAPVKNK